MGSWGHMLRGSEASLRKKRDQRAVECDINMRKQRRIGRNMSVYSRSMSPT